MKLSTKFILLGAFLSIVLFTSVGIIQFKIQNLNENFENYKVKAVDGLVLTQRIESSMNYISRCNRDIMLGNDYDRNIEKIQHNILSIEENFYLLLQTIKNTKNYEEKAKLILETKKYNSIFLNEGLKKMLSLRDRSISKETREVIYAEYKKELTPYANQSRKYFKELKDIKEEGFVKLNKHFKENIEYIKNLICYGVVVSFILIVVILFIFYRYINSIYSINKKEK